MADWMVCGNVKDKDEKPVEVHWDKDSGKIWLKQGSWTKYIPYETADDEREALSKAYAFLHY